MARKKSTKPPTKSVGETGAAKSSGAIFIIAALDMSWRLAIVVLIPIIGGFELDKHLGIAPVLTIVGFLLAMVGVFVILKRAVASADDKFKPTESPR